MGSGQWKIRGVRSREIRARLRRPRGPGTALTAGRLQRGGEERPRGIQGASRRRGPGRAGLGPPGRVLPRAASRGRKAPFSSAEAAFRARLKGSRQQAAQAEATAGQTVPGGWAQPPQGPGEQPPRIPRPVRLSPAEQTPAKGARAGPSPWPVGPLLRPPHLLRVQLGVSAATGNYRRVSRQLQPASRQPHTRGPAPPRPARLFGIWRARTYLSRPLLPAPPDPAPARDVAEAEDTRLRGHTPLPLLRAAPPQRVFLHLRQD